MSPHDPAGPRRGESAFEADFVVGVGFGRAGRQEQHAGTTGREPAGQELGRGGLARGLAEERLQPAADMAQLGGPTTEHRDHGPEAQRSAQEVRDRVYPLREDVGADPGLVVEQRALVRIGGWRVHAGTEVDIDVLVPVPALHDRGRGVGTGTRSVDQVVLGEDPDRRGPLDRGQRLVERAADRVVVREQARCLARAQEEMGEGVGAIFERARQTRGCGNRHCDIITQAPSGTKRTTDALPGRVVVCLSRNVAWRATADAPTRLRSARIDGGGGSASRPHTATTALAGAAEVPRRPEDGDAGDRAAEGGGEPGVTSDDARLTHTAPLGATARGAVRLEPRLPQARAPAAHAHGVQRHGAVSGTPPRHADRLAHRLHVKLRAGGRRHPQPHGGGGGQADEDLRRRAARLQAGDRVASQRRHREDIKTTATYALNNPQRRKALYLSRLRRGVPRAASYRYGSACGFGSSFKTHSPLLMSGTKMVPSCTIAPQANGVCGWNPVESAVKIQLISRPWRNKSPLSSPETSSTRAPPGSSRDTTCRPRPTRCGRPRRSAR